MYAQRISSQPNLRNSTAIGALLLLSLFYIPGAFANQNNELAGNPEFRSTCAAQYAKKRPDESAVSASLWCECMDSKLTGDAKIDFVNSAWLMTVDPHNQASRAKAARILNVSPNEIQDQFTPAVTAALQSLMARLREPSAVATEHCLTSLNYKKK